MCSNYRGLSLILHEGKLLEKVIEYVLLPYLEKFCIPESQNGFRSGRSTIDSIFCSKLLSFYCREKGVVLFKCFIDLEKAYDKISREILWLILGRLGIPPKMINLIKALHEGAMARVRVDGVLSAYFELINGLKQGSVFGPVLFNIFSVL